MDIALHTVDGGVCTGRRNALEIARGEAVKSGWRESKRVRLLFFVYGWDGQDGQNGDWQRPSTFMQLLYQNQPLNIKTEAKKGLPLGGPVSRE